MSIWRLFLGKRAVNYLEGVQSLPAAEFTLQRTWDHALYVIRRDPLAMFSLLWIVLLVVLAVAGGQAVAQRSRREVTKATTPQDDAKANSDKVPEVYAVSGQFERIVVLRFK